jgi:type IV pilus assembly protein PilZ
MKQVLAVGLGREAMAVIEPFLDRSSFAVDRMARGDTAAVVVAKIAFHLVIAEHPLPGLLLSEFVALLRRPDAPNARTPLIVVGHAARLNEVKGLLRDGDLALAIGDSQPLLKAASAVLGQPLRMAARFFVRLEVELRSGRELLAGQTDNISETGMFIRTPREYPMGTRVAFQFTLPSERAPIQGEAEVVRRSSGEGGQPQGVGVRFNAFRGEDEKRLREFLRAHADRQATR